MAEASGGVDLEAAAAFLTQRFAPEPVGPLEVLGGGAWSRAYGFRVGDDDLVARFGPWREDFEADAAAMAYAGPDLPVPRVLEVGDALGGAYALSERHRGTFLEDLDAEALARLLPRLLRAFDALRNLPPPVPALGDHSWRQFLVETIVDVPGGRVSGWRSTLAADADLDAMFTETERELRVLLPRCPELRHVLHLDLLHANVLVAPTGDRLEAVFDWACTTAGDFVYELAWFSFWSYLHPAISEVDVVGAARRHLEASGVDITGFDERLRAYELHIGATHLAYHAFTGEADALRGVADRLRPLVG